MKGPRKGRSSKVVTATLWTDNADWKVCRGELRRGQGRPTKVTRLFTAVGEKIPVAALAAVKKQLRKEKLSRTGVYVAHDSMGTSRYIGRGNIFVRLNRHFKRHRHELIYFSFYVVEQKMHEREIETLLIRAAGPSLHFNERKKRVDIAPGHVRDFEPGTIFIERQQRRGRRAHKKKRAA